MTRQGWTYDANTAKAKRRRVRLAAVRLVEALDSGVETEEALEVFNGIHRN